MSKIEDALKLLTEIKKGDEEIDVHYGDERSSKVTKEDKKMSL